MAAMRWGEAELQLLGLFGAGYRSHGYAVVKATGLKTSTVYQVLKSFERAGYVTREAERLSPNLSPREPKVTYCGTTVASDELLKIQRMVGCIIPTTA